MPGDNPLISTFTQKAELVSAVVDTVSSFEAAVGYTVDLCDRKDACQLLVSGCEAPLSATAEDLCDIKQQKVVAAPALGRERQQVLEDACADRGIAVVAEGLRDHLAGIDIGFTVVDYGIAETGTLVLDSSSEEMRLATMISEIHVALLPVSRLRMTAFDLESELAQMMDRTPNYTAFITGASRTADIERVLALGVHGPLALHVLLWEGC